VTLAVPEAGDVSVLVARWNAGTRGPRLTLSEPARLPPGVVVASAVRRAGRGWTAVVVLGRRPGAARNGASALQIRLMPRDAGRGRSVALSNVGRARQSVVGCPFAAAVAAAARHAVWIRSSLGRGTAPQFAAAALAGACAPRDARAQAELARLYGPGATASAPASSGPPAPPPGGSTPPALPSPSSPPAPPAPPPPALTLTLSYRHAPGGSYVCVALDAAAGARVVLELIGPSAYTAITTIPSARATQVVAIEIYEPGAYSLNAVATTAGVATTASGALRISTAQGTGTCGAG